MGLFGLFASQDDIERAYGEGGQAAQRGDLLDELRHTLGPIVSLGLETDEARAWDKGFSDERGEIHFFD